MARLARFGMFSAIGLTGFGLQTAMLAWLTRGFGWHYALAVPATAEVTVLMSFVWHSRWTWRDRPADGMREHAGRLGRYQVIRGISIVSSYFVTLGLVSLCRLAPELANTLSVAALSLLNFAVSDRLIFQPDVS